MSAENAVRSALETAFTGERNMSGVERALSVGLGLAMAAGGLRRADAPGALMGLAGAALVARGMTGHCGVKALLDGSHGTAVTDGAPHTPHMTRSDMLELGHAD